MNRQDFLAAIALDMARLERAGPPLITRPNWVLGQCVVCGGRRAWDDLKPYPDIGGVCAQPTCGSEARRRQRCAFDKAVARANQALRERTGV